MLRAVLIKDLAISRGERRLFGPLSFRLAGPERIRIAACPVRELMDTGCRVSGQWVSQN